MKKILLDARKIDDFGIGEYIKSIFGTIADSEQFDTEILFDRDHPVNFGKSGKQISVTSKNYNIFEQIEIPFKTMGKGDYIYFSPHYIYPLFMGKRLVVTVHDLIHFKFPDFFKPKIKVYTGELFLKRIKKNAMKIFTVSKNTKKDMIDMFGFHDEQISVIYNGLNNDFFVTEKKKTPLPHQYLLYTGNIKPHKNIAVLIEAFRIASRFYKDLKLVLAGAEGQLPEYFNLENIKNRIITTGYLPRKELINYIDNCEIFIFPSLYEGFGFPPLEAMSRGKAVISSPEGSLKEILGDAPVYFNPHSPEDLFNKISSLIDNRRLRKDIESKGVKRASEFTLERSVSAYLKELKNLISQRSG